MKRKHGHSLFALWALLLQCTSQQTASSSSSSSQLSSKAHVEMPLSRSQTDNSFRNSSHISRGRPDAEPEEPIDHMTFNTSRAEPERTQGRQNWAPEDRVSPLCAYRVVEGGVGGPLCFRHTISEYKCQEGQCRTVVSSGKVVANILTNGSVLLQWTYEAQSTMNIQGNKTNGQSISTDHGTNATSHITVMSGRRHRRGGFELVCWWNGSYTQFECTGVQLAHGCRDYLLTELHENIPYRFCLRSLDRARVQDCVEFTLPPSGMQDIVIAMTTVGGAICVMLVIICLLVAYITENIMSPTTTHTYSYRTHSCH